MWSLLRRFLAVVIVAGTLTGSAVGETAFPYAPHPEKWFGEKFEQLHSNPGKGFVTVSKKVAISPPDDAWVCQISIVVLFKKGAEPPKGNPYMVVVRAEDALPDVAVPVLTNFLARKYYEYGTPLAWVRLGGDTEGVTKYILVGPAESFVEQDIFKVPPAETVGI